MKKLTLIAFMLLSFHLQAQDIIMQTGAVNASSGTFFDSGGSTSNYSNNENFILTLCPDIAGQKIELTFTEFITQLDIDVMTVYDGDSTSAPLLGTFSGGGAANNPGVVSATDANTSGCITIQFISDGTGVTVGWTASISVITDCQNITSQLDSSLPAVNADGQIQVCIGESISLNGSGNFETDGTGATYEWDLGNGQTVIGQAVTISYNVTGVYFVNLNIRDTNTSSDPLGCSNTNAFNQIIQVADEPDFTGTEAVDSILCFGDTTVIEGIVNPTTITYNCPPPLSQETFLPDGNGVAYSTCITVDCFGPNDVITAGNQVLDICLNLEHSYSGDLDIYIVSPNGQQVQLYDQGGGGTYFGGANNLDDNSVGVGADYCFSGSASTLLVDATTVIAGSNPPNNSWTPGSYLPVGNFDDFIGSPVNGEWCIIVMDNLAIDNGNIFSWELNFDTNLIPMQDFPFTPAITSESWDADATITAVNGNSITVAPPTSGEFCYTYRVFDDIGCEYFKEVCINVADQNQAVITYYEDADGDGFGDVNGNTIMICSDTPPDGYVGNKLDCNDADDTINPDAIDNVGNNIDENCDGVDGNLLSVEEITLDNLNITPNPFNNNFTIDLPPQFSTTNINIEIYDLNGRLVYNKSSIVNNGIIKLNNLDVLDSAPYILKISNIEAGILVVKKVYYVCFSIQS